MRSTWDEDKSTFVLLLRQMNLCWHIKKKNVPGTTNRLCCVMFQREEVWVVSEEHLQFSHTRAVLKLTFSKLHEILLVVIHTFFCSTAGFVTENSLNPLLICQLRSGILTFDKSLCILQFVSKEPMPQWASYLTRYTFWEFLLKYKSLDEFIVYIVALEMSKFSVKKKKMKKQTNYL